MKLVRPKRLNPGDRAVLSEEEPLEDIRFNVIKLSNRPKPSDKRRILITSTFSEFGCETLGAMYCLPQLFQQHAGKYKIVMGWYGREYFYRHLADEFWEVAEEHQHLREYCRAFHHQSKNLAKIEKQAEEFGVVVPSHVLGHFAVGVRCNKCNRFWMTPHYVKACTCGSTNVTQSLLGDVKNSRARAVRVPLPKAEKIAEAEKFIKGKPVGIFARGRVCYGRNLPPEFYVKLIGLLEEMGYSPIWLGEKQSTIPCPVDHILDFSPLSAARLKTEAVSFIAQSSHRSLS